MSSKSNKNDKSKTDRKTLEDYIETEIHQVLDNKINSFRNSAKQRITRMTDKFQHLQSLQSKLDDYVSLLNNLNHSFDFFHQHCETQTDSLPDLLSRETQTDQPDGQINLQESIKPDLSQNIIDLTCEDEKLHPSLIITAKRFQESVGEIKFDLIWYPTCPFKEEEIIFYEIYSVTSREGVMTLLGKVKSLKLPMTCSLKSQDDKNVFSFSVRSVARDGSFGDFSPWSIALPYDGT